MPVGLRKSSGTENVTVKELLVGDDGAGKTSGCRRADKLRAIKIRILPRKKQRPKVDGLSQHHHHQCQQQQQGRRWPTTAKRTRFSCWSSEDSDNHHHLHHCDVAADDVTWYSATAVVATASTRLAYRSSGADELNLDSCRLLSWNDDKVRDHEEELEQVEDRRRRSYRTEPRVSVDDDSCGPDEVFEDLAEGAAGWHDSGRRRDVLGSMNGASGGVLRRHRVSLPPPRRGKQGGPRAAVPNAAASQGQAEQNPAAPPRRALTDLETTEVANGYKEVQHVGDAATVVAAESAKRRDEDTGACPRERTPDDSKCYEDDDEGYLIHVPHDHIADR